MVKTFEYTGDVQTFTAPKAGYYQVELWGAQGGGTENGPKGGKGAHVTGTIYLKRSETIYVLVGGQGNGGTGGYNGGVEQALQILIMDMEAEELPM